MSRIDIRDATKADTPAILETLRLALGQTPLLERTEALWRWKHSDNPFGPSIVLVAVTPEGSMAGVRAFMRWQLETPEGDTVEAVRPVDTATHPDFLRQGIFRRLTLSAIEVARAAGVHLIFNTPNQKSAPGYLSMGWHRVGDVGVQIRPRPGRTVDAAIDEVPRIERWAPRAAAPAELPMPSSGARGRLRTSQSAAYHEWRYRSHPTASYGWVAGSRGGGLVVRASVRKGRSELVACDLLGEPDPTAVRRASRISRARYMAGWFSEGTPRRRASFVGGLMPVPWMKTLQLVANPLVDMSIDTRHLGSWDLSTSDLELL